MEKSDIGTLCLRLGKNEGLLIETSDGPIQIYVKDAEKHPIISRIVIRAPKKISRIETFLNTYFKTKEMN